MTRSNRLVMVVGVFLAIVAFVGILLTLSGTGGGVRGDDGLTYRHDEPRKVGCWTSSVGMFCLPDSQYVVVP